MAPGNPERKRQPKIMVKIPTQKIIVAMVDMYKSEDPNLKETALEFAGHIIEAYEDNDQFKKDVFHSYVSGGNLTIALKKNIERMYPEEANILKEIFGAFLFGGV